MRGASIGNRPVWDPNDGNNNSTPEHYAPVRFFPVASSGSGSAPLRRTREPLQVCNDGVDNDGDTLMDLLEGDGPDSGNMWDCNPRERAARPADTDTDGDGFTDATRSYRH